MSIIYAHCLSGYVDTDKGDPCEIGEGYLDNPDGCKGCDFENHAEQIRQEAEQ